VPDRSRERRVVITVHDHHRHVQPWNLEAADWSMTGGLDKGRFVPWRLNRRGWRGRHQLAFERSGRGLLE
jgi:hypothetical protein